MRDPGNEVVSDAGNNLGQNKMEQLSPFPAKAMMKARRSKNVVQMFQIFCPRLYLGFQHDKTKGASN